MPIICTCSSHCPLSGYHDAGCCEKTTCDCWCHRPGEHRGSRPGVDPTFADAAFRPFTPEQEEMFKEKSERIWRTANGVRR
jgi:hypothetical protein